MGTFKMKRPANPGPYRFEILGTDTDVGDALHGSSLFSFMQEAAYRNAECLGMGASELDGRGFCWLLLKISVRLERLPAWDDMLEVHTWNRGAQRLLFLRDFRFRVEGTPGFFGAASSEWLVGQAVTHRPQRPETVFASLARNPGPAQPGDSDAPGGSGGPGDSGAASASTALPFACPKLPAMPADVPDVLQKFADYSDIDRNRHVNNTRYVAWAVDALHAGIPAGERHLALRGIDINFLSEVRPGEQIRLRRLAVDVAQLNGLPPAAMVPGTAAMLVEGHRHPDRTPVFRCLLQYSQPAAD